MKHLEQYSKKPARWTVGDQLDDRSVVDHCVHGLATIRLIDAPRKMAEAVVSVLGPSQGNPSDDPDICVTFVDKLIPDGELHLLGRNGAAFDDRNFYLLDRQGQSMRIDLCQLGKRCELVCERGVSKIPLLVPILGMCLLRNGYVLLHASSFVYNGKGVMVAAWEQGGKTETLLPFMAAGAHYLADEWTIVGGADGAIRGLTAYTPIWNWQFQYLPQYWKRIRPADRQRIRLVRLYQRIYRAIPGAADGESLPFRLLRQIERELGHVARAFTLPHTLYGDRVWQGAARLDHVFLAGVVQGPIRVSPISSVEIGRRMIACLAYERRALMTTYNQFRFAFPDRSNELLERAGEQEQDLLTHALIGCSAHEILHPYPVPLHDLYSAVAPYCS